MNKRIFLKAVLDGFLQSLILVCLETFALSVYSSNLSLKQHLLIGTFCAGLSTVVYIVLTLKEFNNKKLAYFSLISIFFFVLMIVCAFAIRMTFGFFIMPLREVNNADGILILFVIGCFVLVSNILRLSVFVISIIMNIHKKKQKEYI